MLLQSNSLNALLSWVGLLSSALLGAAACGEAVDCRGSDSTTPWQAVEYETFFGYPAWMPYQFVSDGEQLLVFDEVCGPACSYWELDPDAAVWLQVETGEVRASGGVTHASPELIVGFNFEHVVVTERDSGVQRLVDVPEDFAERSFYKDAFFTGTEYLVWGGQVLGFEGLAEPETPVMGSFDGLAFNPNTNALRVIPPFRPPEPLDGWPPVAEWTGTHLLAVHPDWVALYDPKTNEWEELDGSRRPPVGGPPGLILIDDVLYAFKDRELYRTGPEVKEWERIEVPNFVSFGRTVASRGRLVTFGADCPGPTMYDPKTQEWTVLSSNGAPWSLEGERFAFGDYIGAVGLYVDHVNQFPALLMLEVPR